MSTPVATDFAALELGLGLAKTAGLITAAQQAQYDTYVADVQKITTDALDPSTQGQLADDVTAFLKDLGISATDLHAADEFAAFMDDVKGNQVGVIRGNTSLFGVTGIYAFIPAGSDQGVSLGLSGT